MREQSRIYRLLVVHAAVLILVGSSVYALVSQREFWPFCNYRMFSQLAGKEGPRGLEVRFVADGEETTFSYTTILLVRQFNIHGLNATLKRIESRYGTKSKEMEQFLGVLLRAWAKEKSREVGEIRLYRVMYGTDGSGSLERRLISEELLLKVGDDRG